VNNSLKRFLLAEVNSRTKESIINFKLFYDLKLAAALDGYDLSLYTPDVDRDGFDIIIDDRDSVRKIQLKTVIKTTRNGKIAPTTTSWGIHKCMLRPDMEFCERLGFEFSPTGVGVQRGVILIELEPDDSGLQISYAYTDIFVIIALNLGLVKKSPGIKSSVVKKLFQGIRDGVSNEKITIPRSVFVDAKSPEHLLGLISMHNRICNGWWHHLLTISENEYVQKLDESKLAAPLKALRTQVADKLILLASGLSKVEP